MNLRRTFAISRRIADLFRRDHRTLALLFVAPLVILGLLGWVMRDAVPPPGRLAVIDQTGVPAGDVLRDRIGSGAEDEGMTFVSGIADEPAARLALVNDQLEIALLLPSTMVDDPRAGRPPTMTIVTPGVVPTDDAGRVNELQNALRDSLDVPIAEIERQMIYGAPDEDFLQSFTPALVGFLVFFLVFVLTGMQFIPVVIVPQGLLAGIFWPVESLPGVLQPLARLMPMTYGIDGLREVLIRGAGLDSVALQLDLAVLAGIAVLLAVLAMLTMRREIA